MSLIALGTACTPAQHAAWLTWRAQDPQAADAFAEEWKAAHLARQPAPQAPQTASGGTVWDRLAECESGGNWSYNGGSGYDGGLQFAPSTWRAMGGTEYADYAWQATRAQQIVIAERTLEAAGWGAWPGCSRQLGLR